MAWAELLRFYIGKKDIVYVKMMDHRMHIQTVDEEIIMPCKNCIEIMSILSEKRFVEYSKSAIVNRYFAERFEPEGKTIFEETISDMVFLLFLGKVCMEVYH